MLRYGSAVVAHTLAAGVLVAPAMRAWPCSPLWQCCLWAVVAFSGSPRARIAPVHLSSRRPGCWRACGVSCGCCCPDGRFGGAAFRWLWRSVVRLAHHCFGSAIVTRSVAAGVRAASAVRAVAATAALAALPLSGLAPFHHHVNSSLQLSSPHLRIACWRAGGVGLARCCLDGHFGRTASEQLWRLSVRYAHTPLGLRRKARLLACWRYHLCTLLLGWSHYLQAALAFI